MRRLPLAAIVLLGVLLTGCSILTSRLAGSGPRPEEYFEGPAADLAGAIRSRDRGRIDELISSGADIEATGRLELTMLQYAVLTSSLPGVEALLAAGADPDRIGASVTALHLAVDEPEVMPALLAAGADPDIANPGTGETPLFRVCVSNQDAGFELLVQAGADLDHPDLQGLLALHHCAMTSKGKLILRMLELGVDPLAPYRDGETFQDLYFNYPPPEVLNEQGKQDRRAVVAWLLGHGYDIVPEAEPYR
ncbi:MAG: hypothetical protein QM804_13140 [Propionicimonas sp.]